MNEVFARQYQQIRFGETGNVIKFFEKEVARLYRILSNAEDDLIRYNVSKRIINYGEQTKQVANLEAQQQNFRNDQLMNYTRAKHLLDYLERQLGNHPFQSGVHQSSQRHISHPVKDFQSSPDE